MIENPYNFPKLVRTVTREDKQYLRDVTSDYVKCCQAILQGKKAWKVKNRLLLIKDFTRFTNSEGILKLLIKDMYMWHINTKNPEIKRFLVNRIKVMNYYLANCKVTTSLFKVPK